jgi:hypothetical protein
VIARLVAAGRRVRAMVRSAVRAAEVRAMPGLDAAAGCEYLDDRIRLAGW